MQTMLISGHTNTGRRRSDNQDAFICKQLWTSDKVLLVVIDGVGGYAGGDKAAALAKDCIEQYMQSPKGDTGTMLREAVIFANNKIASERLLDPRFAEMCCVLTAVVADSKNNSLHYVHVGDTRLYRYRNGRLEKLTRDHSFVGIKEDAGELSEEEAMHHPQRNMILREIGSSTHRIDDEDFLDHGKLDFIAGDSLLLCTDGLSDMITSQQITTVLSTAHALDKKAGRLIRLANDAGGHDNITVVLVRNTLAAPKNTVDPPVESVLPIREPAKKPSKLPGKVFGLWIGFALVVCLVSCWYFLSAYNTASHTNTIPKPITTQKQADINHNQPAAPAVPASLIHTDTIRLSAAKDLASLQHYADSSGKLLYLLPANAGKNRFAAIDISKEFNNGSDTIVLRNLSLKGFETGIKVNRPVFLKLDNILFENVQYPVRYALPEDSSKKSVLIIQPAKQ